MEYENVSFKSGFLVIVALLFGLAWVGLLAITIAGLWLGDIVFRELFSLMYWKLWALILGLFIIEKVIRIANTK